MEKKVHDYVVSVQQSPPPALPPPSLSQLQLLAFWYISTYLPLSIILGKNTPQMKKKEEPLLLLLMMMMLVLLLWLLS